MEIAVVGRAARFQHLIADRVVRLLLDKFLQPRLIIAVITALHHRDRVLEIFHQHRLQHLDPRAQIDRAAHRFPGVRQIRWAQTSARRLLATAQEQIFIQPQLSRSASQRILADKTRAHFRELAFVVCRKCRKQIFAHDQIDHRIAEKFQPLVVVVEIMFHRVGRMRQRHIQHLEIQPADAQLVRQRAKRPSPFFVHHSPLLFWVTDSFIVHDIAEPRKLCTFFAARCIIPLDRRNIK